MDGPRRRLLGWMVLGSWLAGLFLARSADAAATGADFLNVPVSPRPMALGNAYVGLADTVETIGYNPAGLALLPRQEAAFEHDNYVQGVFQDFAAYARPADWGTAAASVNMLRVSPFDSYDANDVRLGSVSSDDLVVTGAAARSFGRLSLGFGGKYLRSRLGAISASGEALDAGALYQAGPRLRLGAALLNAGPGLKFVADSDQLPLTFKVGSSYAAPLGRGASRLLLVADASFPRAAAAYASGGVELRPFDFAALRVGYQGGQDLGSGLTLGGGLDFTRGPSAGLAVDYAFVNMGQLGNAHRLGLRVTFGRPARKEERYAKQ